MLLKQLLLPCPVLSLYCFGRGLTQAGYPLRPLPRAPSLHYSSGNGSQPQLNVGGRPVRPRRKPGPGINVLRAFDGKSRMFFLVENKDPSILRDHGVQLQRPIVTLFRSSDVIISRPPSMETHLRTRTDCPGSGWCMCMRRFRNQNVASVAKSSGTNGPDET
ncbi:hypothetical protein F5148DRAFT_150948 [Russula earlei]|uniref:Uncharacterized protein n=1 Tax=Russula earlei TaxID=71964 RepID=A0ACC0U636_9AGAM|nr:hypothetical protein F5148DRAFT_150948 [Russula earlei]